MTDDAILHEGRRVVAEEARALSAMGDRLGPEFCEAVRAVVGCTGRVVTTAVGKSGVIARKLASTLSSLGCPSIFVHPIEGLHGDLGMVQPGDVIFAISHSGKSQEVVSFLTAVRLRLSPAIIAMVGARGGALDRLATTVLETGVTSEACAIGLAPTTSSTASLALGDAVAVAASRAKGFDASGFATLHPSGALGDRLRTPVTAFMLRDFPKVGPHDRLRDVVGVITRGAIGLAVVVDPVSGRLGIVTDGDIRRASTGAGSVLDRRAADVMSTPPRSIGIDALGMDALMEMERERVTALVVLDGDRPAGVVHLHDILRYGLGLVRRPSKELQVEGRSRD
jgi:arabinose-5-phosphate isomerase